MIHFGADTFMGHQEIMGTLPKQPQVQPFQEKIDCVYEHLKSLNHKVEVRHNKNLRYLLVDDYCTVADNIDVDFGMAYNWHSAIRFLCHLKKNWKSDIKYVMS